MTDMTPIAPMGHNNPPTPVGPYMPEALQAKLNDYLDAGAFWQQLKQIDDKEGSEKATDYVAGSRALYKLIDAERVAQKRPHDTAAQAVQDFFSLALKKVELLANVGKNLQADYLKRENARIAAERIANEKAAAEKAEAARREQELAMARGDIGAQVEAEAAAKAAEKEVKKAAKPVKAAAGSATGAGRAMRLQKVYWTEIGNINHAFVAFRDHPEVAAVLNRLATAAVRAQDGEKTAPNGFTLHCEEKAV